MDPLCLIEDQPRDGREGSDYLGMAQFASVIARTAVGTRGPFTIGVYAGWGEGKTSLLQQAKALIDDDGKASKNAATVWFNAWQFEREEHPLFPLIAAIVDSVEAHVKKHRDLSARVRDGFIKAGGTLRWLTRGMKISAKMKVPLLAEVGVELDQEKAIEAEKTSAGKPTDPLQGEMLYHSAFNQLGDLLAEGKDGEAPKVVVFIDDLDRCLPDNAVRLLENIKLVLSQPGFVFVLALDNTVVEAFLTKRYRDEYGVNDGDVARTYLHKLVQLELPIPRHTERFGRCAELLFTRCPRLRKLGGLKDALAPATGVNPRALVRLTNNLLVDLELWDGEAGDDVALCMLVSRVTHQHLGRAKYHTLADSQDICKRVLSRGDAPAVEPISGARGGRDRDAEFVESVRRDEPLWHLLAGPGRVWLENEPLRRAVYSFHSEREVVTDVPETQQAIFNRAVRRALELPPDAPISDGKLANVETLDLSDESDFDNRGLRLAARLHGLTSLDLDGTEVSDLTAISGLTNLVDLTAERTQVSDLVPLAGLTNLNALTLDGSRVSDLTPLASLTHLELLSVAETQVSDLGPLQHMTCLTMLYVYGTRVTDLTPLRGLTRLATLSASLCQISDLTPLSDLTGLEGLYLHAAPVYDLTPVGELIRLEAIQLGRTQVTDLAPLAGLVGLRYLNVTDTRVNNLAPLARLTNLDELCLGGTPVTDLTPLHGLTNLSKLWVTQTPAMDEQIAELKRKLPSLGVHLQRAQQPAS